jgi:hypothetical protein
MKKLFLVALFILSSCSLFQSEDSGRYTKSNAVENRLEKISVVPWKKTKTEGSDFALNYFLFNSSCRKFDASDLNSLTTSILTGLTELTIVKREKVIHQDRDAVLVIAHGKLDGITRYFRILTTQKNNCIYDLVLIATNKKNLEADTEDYSNFVQLIELN